MNQVDGQLHFKCTFELCPTATCIDPWSTLAKMLRSWVEQSPKGAPPPANPAFYTSWFYVGGEWRALGPAYHFVKTARLIGTGNEHEPQHWAMRYEHPCEEQGRMWRVDAGITKVSEGAYRLSIRTSHYIRPGFIGEEPRAPLPTAPRIIGWLLRSPLWNCYAGSERLYPEVQLLNQGDGEAFRATLEDPGRECPVVLVSKDFHTGQTQLDARKLAWLLLGTASVYESGSTGLDKELEECLGRRFSCWNGMVRVYQPGLRFDNPLHPKRQRYLSGAQIMQQGADATIEMLVRGIARRAQQNIPGTVDSLEDISAFDRERRFEEMKANAGGVSEEWVKLLEEVNGELEKTVRQKDEELQRLRIENADTNDDLARLEYERKAATTRAYEAEKTARGLSGKISVIDSINELPDSVEAVVGLIQRLYPDKIAFTEQAIDSARERDRERDVSPQLVWRGFHAMVKSLHDLFFAVEEHSRDIEQVFRERTGFDLAMTEGKQTKSDAKMLRLRKDTYRETEIDITPHVKLEKGGARAYFNPHHSKDGNLIVVGFIGHLDTAGTRRQKK